MMRLRMYSGIVIAIASIIAGALPLNQLALAEENEFIFTSRFINSLEHASASAAVVAASPATANDAASASSSSSFHVSSNPSMINQSTGEKDSTRRKVELVRSQRQRRELSWWSIALQFVHPPCPPHDKPQPPHCQHHHHKSSGGGSSSSGGGGGGGSWGSDGWGSDGWRSDGWGGDGGGSGWGGDGGGSGWRSDGWRGDGGGSGSDTWGSDGHTQSAQSSFIKNPSSLGFWMLIAAACVAAIAVSAIIVGSRRKAKEQYHPLKGSMERRMRLFGGMADRCFEDRELCGAQQQDLENSLEISERGEDKSSGIAYKQMV